MVKPELLSKLKGLIHKEARIKCFDGEEIVAQILAVSEIEQDVIYDLISTNRQFQYEKYDKQPLYRVKFEDIKSVDSLDNSSVEMKRGTPFIP